MGLIRGSGPKTVNICLTKFRLCKILEDLQSVQRAYSTACSISRVLYSMKYVNHNTEYVWKKQPGQGKPTLLYLKLNPLMLQSIQLG